MWGPHLNKISEVRLLLHTVDIVVKNRRAKIMTDVPLPINTVTIYTVQEYCSKLLTLCFVVISA
jgi:thiamine biosynthesis protein ThiC